MKDGRERRWRRQWVEPGSPADHAALRGGHIELVIGGNSLLLGGDIVVSINGVPMTRPDQLAAVMRGLKVGNMLKLKLFRDGEYREVEYKLPERPLLPGDVPSSGTFSPAPNAAPDARTQMRLKVR